MLFIFTVVGTNLLIDKFNKNKKKILSSIVYQTTFNKGFFTIPTKTVTEQDKPRKIN